MTKAKSKKALPLLSEREEKIKHASKDQCIEDLRNLQKEYPDKYITRRFYRSNGLFTDHAWNVHFGTFHEFRSQAGLQETRQGRKLEVDLAKHVSQDHYLEFFNKEVLQYHNKYEQPKLPGTIKTLLICSDLHDIEIDEFCLEVFIDTCKRVQPDYIVFNGDIFDLYEFSRYNIDPRQCDMVKRFNFVKERIFGAVRKVCPNAQIDFIIGNHEFRLIKHLADKSPFMRVLLGDVMDLSLSDVFGLDQFKINFYSKVDLKSFSPKDTNNLLKKNYKIYHDCFVVSHQYDNGFGMSGTNGHHHQIEAHSDFNILRGPITWIQTPGMHKLDAEYLEKTCKWNLGFLRVFINTETKTVVQDPILVNPEWTVIDGVLYKKN